MADFVFNIAKGRVVEYFNRVDSNDPTNSAIVLVPLSVGDTAANLQDMDDLATVLAATPNEQTAGGWARKTLTDADLSAIAVDDTNNRFPATLPQVTWTGPTTGSDTVALLVCYDGDTTAGTDSNIIPLTYHDFAVTADDNDVILNTGDCFRAS
jgi:hypothetical protein